MAGQPEHLRNEPPNTHVCTHAYMQHTHRDLWQAHCMCHLIGEEMTSEAWKPESMKKIAHIQTHRSMWPVRLNRRRRDKHAPSCLPCFRTHPVRHPGQIIAHFAKELLRRFIDLLRSKNQGLMWLHLVAKLWLPKTFSEMSPTVAEDFQPV